MVNENTGKKQIETTTKNRNVTTCSVMKPKCVPRKGTLNKYSFIQFNLGRDQVRTLSKSLFHQLGNWNAYLKKQRSHSSLSTGLELRTKLWWEKKNVSMFIAVDYRSLRSVVKIALGKWNLWVCLQLFEPCGFVIQNLYEMTVNTSLEHFQ